MTNDYYNNANGDFTRDISDRMRVPDRIMAHNEMSWRNTTTPLDQEDVFNMAHMKVPDRILVAGSEQHISQRSTPRELDLDIGPLPPTADHIRVNTPPRTIKLDDLPYPSEEASSGSPQDKSDVLTRKSRVGQLKGTGKGPDRGVSFDADNSIVGRGDVSLSGGEGMTTYDEIQLMRRQIAKLNHRLMAVELENQQQQQREMVLTVVVSAYFVVKALVWFNKNM